MALLYRNTDMAKWGTGLLRRLHSLEVDDNFWQLDQRLHELETNPAAADTITNITVIGTQMKIYTSSGNEFGPFTLPVAMFAARGNFADGMPYYEMDLVSVPGRGLFLVLQDHVGVAPFDPVATGTDGNPLYLKVFGEDTYIYDFGFFYPGKPGQGIEADGLIGGHMFLRDAYLPALLLDCEAKLKVAPDLPLSLPLDMNGTVIGSLNFAVGAVDGTFVFPDTTQGVKNDVFGIRRPTTIDATARGLTVAFAGRRGIAPTP